MHKTKFENLPNGSYFWRQHDPYKWLKIDNNLANSFEDHHNFVETTDFKTEAVIVNPTTCFACLVDNGHWPPLAVCPSCGTEVGEFEERKRQIAEFTGNPKPHI
jgi:hypothetical protein